MNLRPRLCIFIIIALTTALACSIGISSRPSPAAPSATSPSDVSPAATILSPTAPILVSVSPTIPLPSPTASTSAEFAIILVADNDVLNVRTGAGVSNPIAYTLAPHATGIHRTGPSQVVADSLWTEIQTSAGTGWVNARFLTELVAPAAFCTDARIAPLLDAFIAAVQAEDGTALAPLVSPAHGLTLRLNWPSPDVNYQGSVLTTLFTDTSVRDWGLGFASGLPITGTFRDIALPFLHDAFGGTTTRHCNDIENGSGPTTALKIWPPEFANLNYVAVYRAAAAGDDLNWRTWAVGVEYVEGIPYAAFLVQYHWEP